MRFKQYSKYRNQLENKIYEAERVIELNEIKKKQLIAKIEEINKEVPPSVLDFYVPNSGKSKLKHDEIVNIILNYYGITSQELFSKTRVREIIEKRQICQYFLRYYTKLSLDFIGEITGKKHHTTVINSIKIITGLNSYDKAIQKQVKEIRQIIKNKITTRVIKPRLRRNR